MTFVSFMLQFSGVMCVTSADAKMNMSAASVHDHSQCIDGAIERARAICEAKGSRFTPQRQQVLELVWQSHKAVKAYDILDMMGKDGVAAKPPTVYRALDFLMEHGLVHKIESLNAFVGCPFGGANHIAQFLICDSCDTVSEISSEALGSVVADAAAADGFQLSGQTIELHGVCRMCREG